jgi:hypothetical protein
MNIGSLAATSDQNPGLRYTCLQTIMTRGAETAAFPTQPCPAGIKAIHHFPALVTPSTMYLNTTFANKARCWDGKHLDSPNHQSHMYSTTIGGFQVTGACPSSHPVRVPQFAYETM